ncbi:invasion associated locus B family protein [Ancylobacter pratisalsi]|uniref:Invasion associated locus B family protein n=1 Tax=Ancylobacter pratisalsi TaxID=1745854 RepID=A0A6P1YQV0_9HYPH|nr:invasion associated locus B family protein [Ancylobacter pratisalsi]QIB35838.1 invasion associated locus B family protein [Ancylobacter pratisalsi]
MTKRSLLARNLAGAVLALSLVGGAATAQAQQAKPAAKPAAPAAKPAEAAGGQQTTNQQIPAVTIPWVKRCVQEPSINKEVCNLEQTVITDTGQFLVRFGIFEVKDDPKKAFIVSFPTGLLLRNGFRVALANEQPILGTFIMCDNQVCRGDLQIDQGFIDRMKKAPGLTLQVANAVGRVISYPIGLGDFAKVYDGPQTDPKVFDAELKKIQDQVKARQDALQAEAAQRDQQTKQGLEKLGAEKLKGAQPAQ